MADRNGSRLNQFRMAVEVHQAGKLCVRLQVHFPRRGWTLPCYFLTSSLNHSRRKLAQTIRFLQQHEERLWFWAVDRSDDPGFTADLLAEAGLRLDRRGEFPRRCTMLAVAPEKPVSAFLLAPLQRGLAEAARQNRVALASD